MSFLSVNPAGSWAYGEANSFTQAVTVASGGFEGDSLVLHDARRPGGALTLLLIRRTLAPVEDGGFTLTSEASKDFGETWRTTEKRTYTARESQDGFFPVRADLGLPAPGRVAEATQFDFLLGEFDRRNWLLFGPQTLRWPDHATAVYALDGHAVMEFGWNDFDPSLPDAATTILRIYNEAQRRWETLYLNNRGNAPLHFGGVQEDDQVVLTTFGSINDGTPMPQWIFYDIRPDAYRWKARVSSDRGEDYNLAWAIDFQRKGVEAPDAKTAPATAVHTTSADGTTVYGDHYRPGWSGAPTVVLFHQAGGDARGEYSGIARRLLAEGYEVFAWDARAGGERFGQANRTAAAFASAETQPGFCDAYPDLEAALQFSVRHGGGGRFTLSAAATAPPWWCVWPPTTATTWTASRLSPRPAARAWKTAPSTTGCPRWRACPSLPSVPPAKPVAKPIRPKRRCSRPKTSRSSSPRTACTAPPCSTPKEWTATSTARGRVSWPSWRIPPERRRRQGSRLLLHPLEPKHSIGLMERRPVDFAVGFQELDAEPRQALRCRSGRRPAAPGCKRVVPAGRR